MKEVWKPAFEFEGLYEVSNTGRIRGLKSNKIIAQNINRRGYLQASMCKKSYARSICVHRLVAMAFVENQNCFLEVNHIDGNKLNNVYSNLEWTTRSRNIKHAYDNGLMKCYFKGKTGGLSPISKKVFMIDLNNNTVIRAFDSVVEAEREVGITGISAVCNGKWKTAGGYGWSYLNKNENIQYETIL